jgi:hypothetical protein
MSANPVKSAREKENAMRLIPLALALLLLCACGGESPGDHPLAGTYVVDVQKSLAAAPLTLGKASEGAVAHVQGQLTASDYVLVLSGDWTFRLTVGSGEDAFTIEGRWGPTANGVTMETQRAQGEPVLPADGGGVPTIATREGDWLVLSSDGRTVYLSKS